MHWMFYGNGTKLSNLTNVAEYNIYIQLYSRKRWKEILNHEEIWSSYYNYSFHPIADYDQ